MATVCYTTKILLNSRRAIDYTQTSPPGTEYSAVYSVDFALQQTTRRTAGTGRTAS